jgi:hypothetical protein
VEKRKKEKLLVDLQKMKKKRLAILGLVLHKNPRESL